jgi:hypothetical protein
MRVLNKFYYFLHNTLFIDLMILLCFSLIPFWRMGINGLWEAFDQGFPLYPIQRANSMLYVWNDFVDTGRPLGIVNSLLLPWEFINSALAYLGLPPNVIQRLMLVLWLAFTGWGMYYLTDTLLSSEDGSYKRVASISASVFYMFNPFVIYWMTIGAYPQVTLTILPFTLAFLIKGFNACHDGKSWIKYALLMALSSSFLVMIPEAMIIILFFLALYIAYIIIKDLLRHNFRVLLAKIKFLGFSLLAISLLNSYWLLPNIQANIYHPYLQSTIQASPGIARVLRFFNAPMVMIQTFRLQIAILAGDQSLTPLSYWVVSPYAILAGVMLSILSIYPILSRPRKNCAVFFTMVLTLSLGFASGIGPFSSIYLWLYEHFTPFSILSDPHKFLYLASFSYSFLLGVASAKINKFFSRSVKFSMKKSKINVVNSTKSTLVLTLVVVVVLANSYPLLTGNLYGFLEPLSIPGYYVEARNWLKSQNENFRIVKVPLNQPGWAPAYTWSPYSISISAIWAMGVFPMPTLDSSSGWPATQQIYSYLLANKSSHLGQITSLWNVKYFIIADDMVDPSTGKKMTTDNIRSILNHQNDIEFINRFGELEFYKNKAWSDNLVYGSATYLIFPEQLKWDLYRKLFDVHDDFDLNKMVLLTSNNLPNISAIQNASINVDNHTPMNWSTIDNNIRLSYRKVNPTKYEIHAKASKPFILVLSTTYDPLWTAKIDGATYELKHFEANFYANGWYIDETGEFNIDIEYIPQKALETGILLSGLTFAFTVAYFIVLPMITKLRKTRNRVMRIIKPQPAELVKTV